MYGVTARPTAGTPNNDHRTERITIVYKSVSELGIAEWVESTFFQIPYTQCSVLSRAMQNERV